jgi:hypothetical protein
MQGAPHQHILVRTKAGVGANERLHKEEASLTGCGPREGFKFK